MRIDPRPRARAFTLLEVVVVFLIVSLMMLVVLGLIRNRASPKRDVPPLPDKSAPVMIERDGSRKATPKPAPDASGEKPGFR